MSDKKEVIITLTDSQRAQIKSATGQDLTELKVGLVDVANPLASNPLDDRSNPTMLADRANPLLADRSNPTMLTDRSNPLALIEE